ncbi:MULTISPECIES: hypothetical protein [unclassified Psychrobacter]|uniref:hypothetical protein n=1 Tax=unclassified Psychrobacter TaxID=196806 RepID=UPI0025FDC8B4|nr:MULTISPECIES: hypothetical protein [unclassified Psychrobacter]
MTSPTSLRIDTPINPESRIRLIFYMALATAMLVLAGLASLALWQYVLVLIISVAVVSYLALSRPILLHISQPPLDKSVYQRWQLLMRTSRGDTLWQSELEAVSNYHWVICFKFIIIEPYQRHLSVTVFRDQVSAEQWRKFTILAHTISPKTA